MAAKKAGVRVLEFWIGMGPAIFSKQMGETIFKLCIFPIGGACVMDGEDEDVERQGTLNAAPIGWRAIILAAGAFMNFLLGFVIILLLTLPNSSSAIPIIDSFADGFPSRGENMLLEGDQIVSMNGYRVFLDEDVNFALSTLNTDGTFDVCVKRNGETVNLQDVPLKAKNYDGTVRYGINLKQVELTIPQRVQKSAYRFYDNARQVWISLKLLISRQVSTKNVSGPVGITTTLATAANAKLSTFFYLVSIISINLGIMNLLPLPALDGGRLLFLAIEFIIRRPIPRKYEGLIHLAGMAAIILLMIATTVQDISRLM